VHFLHFCSCTFHPPFCCLSSSHVTCVYFGCAVIIPSSETCGWGAEHGCLSFISFIPSFVDVDLSGWNLITHVPGGQDLEKIWLFCFLFPLCGEETKRILVSLIQAYKIKARKMFCLGNIILSCNLLCVVLPCRQTQLRGIQYLG
jgi:hypothetical protein